MVERRAEELGIVIPEAPEPKGSYVPTRRVGDLVFTAGMGPVENGVRHYLGRVGEEVTVDDAYQSARLAAINCLGALKREVGSLNGISIVKVNGYIRSAPGFDEQPRVLNGASDLLEQIFTERGKHARTAIGVSELPFGISVEVEMVAEVERSV